MLLGCQSRVSNTLCHNWVGTVITLLCVASSLLLTHWHWLVWVCCSTPSLRGEWQAPQLRVAVASGDAEPTAQNRASIWGMQWWDTMQWHPLCASQLQQSACKGKLGPGLEKAWNSSANLYLQDWGFAWIARTNEWGQLHLKMGLGWYLNP